jgi:hypothetical protein
MIANRGAANTECDQQTPNDTHHTIGQVCVYELDECEANENKRSNQQSTVHTSTCTLFFAGPGKGGLRHR